jgi:hypothetical protein
MLSFHWEAPRLKPGASQTKGLMDAHRLMFIVVLLSGIAVSIAPARATCPGPLTLEEQFARNRSVFLGRAIGQQIVPRTGSRQGTRATETTFEVEELWKGPSNATLRLQTCGWNDGSEALTCSEDFIFVVGSRYVVFAAGDPLKTSGCQPTALVDRAKETLQWLSGKPHKKAG